MTDQVRLRDYGHSRAVLMGTAGFRHLPTVPAAANSLHRMADVLSGPLCGWPADRLTILRDEPGPGNLPDRLITEFEEATDIALFYYVGHGLIDADDQLCLGTAGSRTEVHRRAATSLQFGAVRRALLDSPAAMKIIILDCCFSGLATQPAHTLAASAGDVLDKTVGTGAYTMAASSAYGTAWFETDPAVQQPQTYFTRHLCDLIQAGIPGQPAELRIHQLFRQLQENLIRTGRPAPQARSLDAARDFVFARNAAPPEVQVDPQAELERARERLHLLEAQLRERRPREDPETRPQEPAEFRAETGSLPPVPQQQIPPEEVSPQEVLFETGPPEETPLPEGHPTEDRIQLDAKVTRRTPGATGTRRRKTLGIAFAASVAVAAVVTLRALPSGGQAPATGEGLGGDPSSASPTTTSPTTQTPAPTVAPMVLTFTSTTAPETIFYPRAPEGYIYTPHPEEPVKKEMLLYVGEKTPTATIVFTARAAAGHRAPPAAALHGSITLVASTCGAVDVSVKTGSTEATGLIGEGFPLSLPQHLAPVSENETVTVTLTLHRKGDLGANCSTANMEWPDPGLDTVN